MLLAGEPGIGKTTLAARFASDVYDQDGLVVYGRSDEDLGVPYQPWIEALTQLVTHAPEPVLAAHVAARGAHLARLVPEARDAVWTWRCRRARTRIRNGSSCTAV